VIVAPGFIHAHFREYNVEHLATREKFIALCLNATQQELIDLDLVRQHAEAVLIEHRDEIRDVRGLIRMCEDEDKREYLKSFGMWGAIDERVKQRIDDFLAHASKAVVYQLAPRGRDAPNYILDACIEYPDLPVKEVIQHAREAQRKHDAGSKQDAGNMPGTPPRLEEDHDLTNSERDDQPSTRGDLFSGMGRSIGLDPGSYPDDIEL
jgi:hypothetical protein